MSENTDIAPVPSEGGHLRSEQVLTLILQSARDPGVDVAKMNAMFDLHQRMVGVQAREAFNSALRIVQSQVPRVKKNGTIDMGSKGQMKFARFEDMDTVLRPLLVENGFSVSFTMNTRDGGGGIIEATLLHSSGHEQHAQIPLPTDTGAGRNNLQAQGSTLSYGKRYLLEMLFNIVREGDDDDGNKGGEAFITDDQAEELRALASKAGRDENGFMQSFSGGKAHHFNEVEPGMAFDAVRGALIRLVKQREPS